MVVDGAQVEDDDPRRGRRAGRRARRARCSSTCRRSRPRRRARSAERLRAAGHAFVDAPVTGSSPEGRGRDADDHVRRRRRPTSSARRPLFEVDGREDRRTAGEAGQGQAVKVHLAGRSPRSTAPRSRRRSRSLARQAGVDLDALLESMDGGSSDSTMRALKGKPMLEHDFTPLFKLEHMLKDVQLCLEEARGAGAAFPFAGARRRALRRRGRARARRAGLRGGARGRRGAHRRRGCDDLARCRSLLKIVSVRENMPNLQGYFAISRLCA